MKSSERKPLYGIPDGLKAMGLPEGCVGAVALLDGRGFAMVRCEFADRWEDYSLNDNGDGTASPDLAGGIYLTARRVYGTGPVLPFQVPRMNDGRGVFQ